MFNTLFSKIHTNHFAALPQLNQYIHASDEIKGQKFVKLFFLSYVIKFNFQVRLCWKLAKQEVTTGISTT